MLRAVDGAGSQWSWAIHEPPLRVLGAVWERAHGPRTSSGCHLAHGLVYRTSLLRVSWDGSPRTSSTASADAARLGSRLGGVG